MVRTTPGLDFIGKIALKLGTLAFALLLVDSALELSLSTWALLLSPALLILAYVVGRMVVGNLIRKMEASQFGARLPFGPMETDVFRGLVEWWKFKPASEYPTVVLVFYMTESR
jgi:hypothetical protein